MTNNNSNFWCGRSVFVTGGTGLLGSWLIRSLLERDANVVCLARDWVPESELFQSEIWRGIRMVHGDVREQETLERVLGEYEVDTVFHLAAQTIVGIANRNPVGTFDANIRGTWALLEACRRSPTVQQIIVASSDKAYGSHEKLPYAEDAALEGRHPYDVSKSCADLIAQSYAITYELPVCITRCGNLFGGGDLNWNRLIPGTIRSALLGERPIIRSNGSNIRDYFYVEDGVYAYLTLAENLAKDRNLIGEAFNFSNELQVPVLDLVREILHLTGRDDIEPDVLNGGRHEILHQYLNASKARENLGWRPKFTLQEGLERTIPWYRDIVAK